MPAYVDWYSKLFLPVVPAFVAPSFDCNYHYKLSQSIVAIGKQSQQRKAIQFWFAKVRDILLLRYQLQKFNFIPAVIILPDCAKTGSTSGSVCRPISGQSYAHLLSLPSSHRESLASVAFHICLTSTCNFPTPEAPAAPVRAHLKISVCVIVCSTSLSDHQIIRL